MERKDGKFDYYASLRCILDDQIIGMTKGNHNDLFLSVKGVSKISYKPYTFFGKADYFQDKIRRRHIRYGFVGRNKALKRPATLTTAEMIDTDNDGPWSYFTLEARLFAMP